MQRVSYHAAYPDENDEKEVDMSNTPPNPNQTPVVPAAPSKKPVYKKWWFWVIVIVVVFVIAGASSGAGGTASSNTSTASTTEVTETVSESTSQEPDVPKEYKNALNKAQLYSDTMYMSKNKIYDQLTSEYGEDFSKDAAQYAIDNVEADWNKNALEKAKSYQESMSMSKSKIKDQLTSEYGEGFTQDQAKYAIEHLDD